MNHASAPVYAPAQRQKPRRTLKRIALVIIALSIVIIVATSLLGGSSGASATYRAKVQDYVVINPADLAVTVSVTNTGKAAGAPDCTVQAQDPSYAYHGIDEGTLTTPIQPGAFAVYVDNVTITGQGARYVTHVTVSCSS